MVGGALTPQKCESRASGTRRAFTPVSKILITPACAALAIARAAIATTILRLYTLEVIILFSFACQTDEIRSNYIQHTTIISWLHLESVCSLSHSVIADTNSTA